MLQASKLMISHPSAGISPSGFVRLHMELLPREVGRLIGYDPRVLMARPLPRGRAARGTRNPLPHNVSQEIVGLQNAVQRSIDNDRVAQMVDYLVGAMERAQFADWGSIELVTTTSPDMERLEADHVVGLEIDAEYFIADGQHRYCALLDFLQGYPQYAERFTQSVTISVLPQDKLVEWAGQEFHDRNYFSVPVRAGKALSVDTRDPINWLTKALADHPVVQRAGGIAYDRDTLLKEDTRFTSHTILHRFVRGFLLGRPGLDRGVDTRVEVHTQAKDQLWEYFSALGELLPQWTAEPAAREAFLTRTSVVLSALAVVGNDLYSGEPELSPEQRAHKLVKLRELDWRRTNLQLVGVVGSEKDGQVQPASSRQAIDATIRYLREKLDLMK